MHTNPNFDYQALYMYSNLPYRETAHWSSINKFTPLAILKKKPTAFELTALKQWRSQGESNSQPRRDKPKL